MLLPGTVAALRGASTCSGASSSDSPQSQQPAPAPRRITGRVGGLSVARQRDLLKRWKEQETAQVAQPQQERRRRPATDVKSGSASLEQAVVRDARERELAKAREARRLEEEAAQRSGLKRGVLLVDAYNVINKWPKCAVHFAAGDFAASRQALLDELVGYAHFRAMKCVVVFDAINSLQKETQRENVTSKLEVVYAAYGSGTADEFIETEVTQLMQSDAPPVVYVATSDRASGDMSTGAGAVVMSADQLIAYVLKSDEEAKEVLRQNRARSMAKEGRRMIARLDTSTSSSLLALRSRLNEEAKQRAHE